MSRRRPDRPVRDVDAELDRLYAEVPDVGCLGLCLDSCTSLGMTPLEQHRIEQRHGVRLPLLHGLEMKRDPSPLGVPQEHCAALDQHGRCLVREDRPAACRFYGAVDSEEMRCRWNCRPAGGLLSEGEASRIAVAVEKLSTAAGFPNLPLRDRWAR